MTESLFGAFTRKESYLNIVYLLLSFPLGIFYFIFVIVGLSVSLSLLFVGVGLLILWIVLAAIRGLAVWERNLAVWLLEARIAGRPPRVVSDQGFFKSLKQYLIDSWTWRGLVFLMLKFPLGIFSFVVCVVLVSASLALLVTPLAYRHVPIMFFDRRIGTSEEALICFLLGLGIALLSIHVTNALAALWRALARLILADARPVSHVAARSGPIIIP